MISQDGSNVNSPHIGGLSVLKEYQQRAFSNVLLFLLVLLPKRSLFIRTLCFYYNSTFDLISFWCSFAALELVTNIEGIKDVGIFYKRLFSRVK